MNCGFCSKAFDEDRSQPTCRACPLGSGCGLVRCPHCGFENPATPRWIAYLKERMGRSSAPRSTGHRREALPVIPFER